MPIDIVSHLRNQNYPRSTQAKRLLWGLLKPLFRASPAVFHHWRSILLRTLGGRIGAGVRIHPSVQVMFPWNLTIDDHVVIGRDVKLYALAPISIASHVLISQGVHLCAGSHDYTQPHFPIAHLPICVESGAWIAADAFIGPGVTIGAGVVVGARAVVTRNVEPATLVAGNPAKLIKRLHR
jgi:putative colanic acid biosynthesis acetyltransferase WcaF